MFFFSSRRRHTRCALVTGVQTCALPIYGEVPRLVPTAPLAQKATAGLSAEQNIALQLAVRNIGAFHADSLPPEHWVETMPGLRVGKVWRPIDRVGLYIPAGATPLFSTLLMQAIPARAAGVAEVVVATPPSDRKSTRLKSSH